MERRRRRQRRKTKNAAAVSEEAPSYVHEVPDDLLRLILLRLDSPIWLLHAACVCKRWRRMVTDGADAGRAFFRLASSLHAPVIFGHYHNYYYFRGAHCLAPSLPPRPPTATIDASHFSFNFLPEALNWKRSDWKIADCHGGLVLLRDMETSDFIVCDPLARRYQAICSPPVVPDQQPARWAYNCCACSFPDVFLLDGDDGRISVSNFRVLYWCDDHVNKRSRPYVFSASTGDGDGGGGGDWLLLRQSELDYSYRYRNVGRVAGRVDGSPYLSLATGSVIALDSSSLEFSKVDLPIRVKKKSRSEFQQVSTFTVVHGSAGPDFASPGTIARIVHLHGNELELFRQVRGSGEWMLEHSIPSLRRASCRLPGYSNECCWSRMVDVTPGGTGFVVLKVYLNSIRRWRLALDVNTMELQVLPDEVFCRAGEKSETFTYTLPWPEFLCPCA